MIVTERDLAQLVPEQVRDARRVLDDLLALPGQRKQRGGHPRLEQHEVAAAGVHEQLHRVSRDRQTDGQKRPDDLERGLGRFTLRRSERQRARRVVDAEALPREHVESDDCVDPRRLEVREVPDARGHVALARTVQSAALSRAALSNLMLCPKAVSIEGSPFNLSRAATLLSTTLGIVPVSMSRFRPRSPAIDPFATIRCCSTRSNGTSAGSRSPCRVTSEQNERAAAIAAPACLWRMAPPRLRTVRSEGRARAQRKSCGDAEVRVEFRRNYAEGAGDGRAEDPKVVMELRKVSQQLL